MIVAVFIFAALALLLLVAMGIPSSRQTRPDEGRCVQCPYCKCKFPLEGR